MRYLNEIKKEIPKATLQVVLSAGGFLIALAINSALASRSEVDTYNALLQSLRAEALINKTVLEVSYGKYYLNGMVLREFSLTSASQCLANPLFVRHARPAEIEALSGYILNLSLANSYRRVAESLQLSDHKDSEAWLESMKPVWGENLIDCGKSIEQVSTFRN
jgi:hypothetical protein